MSCRCPGFHLISHFRSHIIASCRVRKVGAYVSQPTEYGYAHEGYSFVSYPWFLSGSLSHSLSSHMGGIMNEKCLRLMKQGM